MRTSESQPPGPAQDLTPAISATTPLIERCRELLGDEAAHLSDADVNGIRCHAELIARVIVDAYVAAHPRRA
jgi:hypothetical protein